MPERWRIHSSLVSISASRVVVRDHALGHVHAGARDPGSHVMRHAPPAARIAPRGAAAHAALARLASNSSRSARSSSSRSPVPRSAETATPPCARRERLALARRQAVDLVEDQQLGRRRAGPISSSTRAHRRDAALDVRRRGVDHVQEAGRRRAAPRAWRGTPRPGRGGRSRMKPTVSVTITSRSRGKRSRREVGSSVANSLSSTSTSVRVSARSSVLLPAFV